MKLKINNIESIEVFRVSIFVGLLLVTLFVSSIRKKFDSLGDPNLVDNINIKIENKPNSNPFYTVATSKSILGD